MIKSYELAKQMAGVSCLVLQGMLPRIRAIRLADDGVIWNDISEMVRFNATGNLPSGRTYRVLLELSMEPLHRMCEASWLDSDELHNELNKVAQAFNVAVALDGSVGHVLAPPVPQRPFMIGSGRYNHSANIAVVLSAWISAGTERLKTKVRDIADDTRISMFAQVTELDPYNPIVGRIDYEFSGLSADREYALEKLYAYGEHGQSSWDSLTSQPVHFHT